MAAIGWEHASQSEYRGAESYVGSEVRQVVTHRSSVVFLPRCCVGRYRLLRQVETSSRVR